MIDRISKRVRNKKAKTLRRMAALVLRQTNAAATLLKNTVQKVDVSADADVHLILASSSPEGRRRLERTQMFPDKNGNYVVFQAVQHDARPDGSWPQAFTDTPLPDPQTDLEVTFCNPLPRDQSLGSNPPHIVLDYVHRIDGRTQSLVQTAAAIRSIAPPNSQVEIDPLYQDISLWIRYAPGHESGIGCVVWRLTTFSFIPPKLLG